MSEDFPLGKKFYVMRHAKSVDNDDGVVSGGGRDPKLAMQGREEAIKVREILERINPPLNLVVTSELERTKDTGQISCDTDLLRHIPRIVDAGINETFQGKAEGMYENKLRELKNQGIKIAGIESKDDTRRRAIAAVKKNIDGDKTTLFITHGGIVARLLGVALGGEEAVDKMKKYGDLIGRGHAVKNCGVYEFITPKEAGGKWEVNELTLDNNKQIKRDSVGEQVTAYKLITARSPISSELGMKL